MILRITSTDAAAAAEYCLIELQGMLDPFSAAEGYIGNDLGELTVTAVRFLRGYRYVSHAITHLSHARAPRSLHSLSRTAAR